MTWDLVLDIFLDSLKDSALVFAFVFLVHIILSIFDDKISHFLIKRRNTGAIFGSLFGLVPQCGTSVIGADLYINKYITLGTIIAIFLSCSDEAFIAILTSGSPKTITILPLIALKFAIGLVTGIIIDLIYKEDIKQDDEEVEFEHECHSHSHDHEEGEHEHRHHSKFHQFFIHPLLHSLEILAYVFVISFGIGLIIGAVGEENFQNFISANKYLSPLFASIIGLIPNCASSLLITELYLNSTLSFGALLAGLLINSGLGLMVLIKKKGFIKKTAIIVLICFLIAVLSGYIACLISGF